MFKQQHFWVLPGQNKTLQIKCWWGNKNTFHSHRLSSSGVLLQVTLEVYFLREKAVTWVYTWVYIRVKNVNHNNNDNDGDDDSGDDFRNDKYSSTLGSSELFQKQLLCVCGFALNAQNHTHVRTHTETNEFSTLHSCQNSTAWVAQIFCSHSWKEIFNNKYLTINGLVAAVVFRAYYLISLQCFISLLFTLQQSIIKTKCRFLSLLFIFQINL